MDSIRALREMNASTIATHKNGNQPKLSSSVVVTVVVVVRIEK